MGEMARVQFRISSLVFLFLSPHHLVKRRRPREGHARAYVCLARPSSGLVRVGRLESKAYKYIALLFTFNLLIPRRRLFDSRGAALAASV